MKLLIDSVVSLLLIFLSSFPQLGLANYSIDKYFPIIAARPKTRLTWVDTSKFGECGWSIYFSGTRQPFDVKSTYFNELAPFDFKDQLEEPNPVTVHLHRSVERVGTPGFYVFPYFLVIRPKCDDGPYGYKVYDFVLQNNFPSIQMFYTPTTSREVYKNTVRITLKGALVDLNAEADKEHIIIEENPDKVENGGDKKFCHREICYPAFLVPLPFLHFSSFYLNIKNQGLFQEYSKTVYVTPFHSRKNEGTGVLEIAKLLTLTQNAGNDSSSSLTTTNSTNITSIVTDVDASCFFPQIRITDKEDPSLAGVHELLGYDKTGKNDLVKRYIERYESSYPLDIDDFYDPQYTFLSSPIVIIAGFYRPDLLILGDPDMEKFELFQWGYNQGDNGTIFDTGANCMEGSYDYTVVEDGESVTYNLPKPLFAKFEQNLDEENTYYHRRRYAPMNYTNTTDSHAIFDIISFDDRVLIVTASGLVWFYGNSNETVNADKVLKAYPGEKLHGCFKFVRIVKRSLQEYDPILAVTESVRFLENGELRIANQDIYYGRLTNTTADVKFVKIGNEGGIIPEHVHLVETASGFGLGGIADDTSEVVKICNIVKRKKLDPAFVEPARRISFRPKTNPRHVCNIIDGSPMPTKPNVIQLLVKMSFTYFKHEKYLCLNHTLPDCQGFNLDHCILRNNCNFTIQQIILYVIAEHEFEKVTEREDPWTITSIIPRVPCVIPHLESIRTLPLFEADLYFRTKKDVGSGTASCFEEFVAAYEDHIFVERLSYTRQITNHLFLYGKSFLHSSDAGKTFVFSRKFPPKLQAKCFEVTGNIDCTDDVVEHHDAANKTLEKTRYMNIQAIPPNKVMIMAFATNSRYAILTSYRELWTGSTGHDIKIKLRPNLGYSVNLIRQYNRVGLPEAIPFSLMFDSSNSLFELVAVLDKNKTVIAVEKRQVNLDWTQRHQNFAERLLKELKKKGEIYKEKGMNEPEPFKYDVTDFNVYCPFNKLQMLQNYTRTQSRLQHYYLNPPLQHRKFGNTYEQAALINYQVASYSLVFDAFLRNYRGVYSKSDKDPFQEWKDMKGDLAQIAYLKYSRKDHRQFGVIVEPRINNRNLDLKDGAKDKLIDYYFLDYNMIVEYRVSFVTKIGFINAKTDFVKQKVRQIQMNVDNGNGDLIIITTERQEIRNQSKVEFLSYIRLNKTSHFPQSTPGSRLVPVPLTFHFIGAFSRCFDLPHYGMKGESLTFQIMAGCPPATDLLFDWNSTLTSLRFRHKNEHYGESSYCMEQYFVCFYARRDINFHFETLDFSKQVYVPFEGKYKLRVIAGGYTPQTMVYYTEEEIEAYNIQGKSDVSLIWTTSGIEDANGSHYQNLPKDPKTQESVLQAGKTRIIWSCNTLSPCQRITPSLTGRTVFWFRIHVSNKDVDEDTLCLHDHEFNIMLHGFPPSPEILLFVTVAFAMFAVLTLYLLFVCCRNHRKVWRANKLRIWGWCLIILDTFPKHLRNEAEYAEKARSDKDALLMSIQGHLNVPKLGLKGKGRMGEDLVVTPTSSKASMGSGGSSVESVASKDVLPSLKARKAPATWTDMIYEQIISRRLLSIVERNKRMHENILKKVDLVELQKELEERADMEGTRDEDDDEGTTEPVAGPSSSAQKKK